MENGISTDVEINAGLAMARRHNSPFFPSIGQFVEWCKVSTGIKHPPLEACFAELTQFMADNRKDKHNLSPILYHTITRNMDFYRFRQIEKDYDRVKAFEIAFKATLFQVECGESLMLPPDPKTLIEDNSTAARHDSPESVKAAEKTVSGIMAMFDEPEPAPLTPQQIADNERLERLK